MPACRNCRSELLSEAKFCIRCGTSVRATGILARTVSAIAEEVEGGLELTGERRVVTVLFTDISGFTAMSERLDPETVVEILNAFFRVITEPIYRYGGVVDKYIGDAVMALFGAPLAHEDDAERALRAAWDMQLVAKRFAARLVERIGIPVAIRVGINTGVAIAGEVGGDLKREYTVLGDAVNLAQRMEANAPVGSTLVAEETWRHVRHLFRFSEGTALAVKNRAQPVQAYELLGLAAGEIEALPGFVGRTRELQLLRLAWSDAERGSPQIVRLLGEPGVGKTALAREFLATLSFGGAALCVSCNSFDEFVPYALPRALLLAELALIEQKLDRGGVERALMRSLPWKAQDPEGVDAITFLLGLDPGPDFKALAPEHRQAVAFRHANDLLLDKAGWEPCVLLCDNIHWADSGSHAWLQALLDRLSETPAGILVLLALRPGERDWLPSQSRVAGMDLMLRPLTESEAELLLRIRVGDARASAWPDSVLAEMLRRGAGNPEFLEAIAESVIGQDERGGGAAPALPLTLQAHLTARLDGMTLPPDARRSLEAAAVLGGECARRALEAVSDAAAFNASVQELRGRHVLVSPPSQPDQLAFRHPILRDALYDRILAVRRRRLHERAAAHFESLGHDSALVAEHYARAEAAGRAASAFLHAAGRALASFANQDALRLAEQADLWAARAGDEVAEDFVDRSRAIVVQAFGALGQLDRAIALSRGLIASARSPEAALEARERHAHLLLRQGDLVAARAVCDEALGATDLGYVTEPALMKLHARRAQIRLRQGELREAAEDCRTALAGVPADQRWLSGFLHFVAASALHRFGDQAAAKEMALAATADFAACGDRYHLAHALNDLASIHLKLGQAGEAADQLRRSLEIALQIGDLRLRGYVLNNLAILVFDRGDVTEAYEHLSRALEVYRQVQDRSSEGLALMNLGEVLGVMGRWDEAENRLHAAIRVFEDIAAQDLLIEAHRQLASLLIGKGEDARALPSLECCYLLARKICQRETEGAALRLLSEVHFRGGRTDDALAWAAQAIQALEETDATLELGRGYAQLAQVLAALGRREQAETARTKAAGLLERGDGKVDAERLLGMS